MDCETSRKRSVDTPLIANLADAVHDGCGADDRLAPRRRARPNATALPLRDTRGESLTATMDRKTVAEMVVAAVQAPG
jgi:hypothetical protein